MTGSIVLLGHILGVGTLLLQLCTLALFVMYFTWRGEQLTRFLGRYGLHIAFLLTLGVTAMTLFFSEVVGFVPCGLCWFQRIFLFPQVVILGIALWQKRHDVADYIIGLSIPGAVIALYQHYLQMGGSELVACPTAGAGVDCAKRLLFELGYITFPLMSATAFLFLIALMLLVRRARSIEQ